MPRKKTSSRFASILWVDLVVGEAQDSPSKIPIDELRIRPFLESPRVKGFSCGSKDLDDFLNTEEVDDYQKQGLGTTYLVFYRGDLVAYFTVCFDGLRVEYLKTWKSMSKLAQMKLESIPSLKIGRLAVDRRFHRRDIGTHILNYVSGMALETRSRMAVRLLVLQAEPDSTGFYEKSGFEYATPVRRERNRAKRTMFLDLDAADEVA